VNFENLFAAAYVRQANHDLSIETARPEQRRVEHVWSVSGSDNNYAVINLKTIHFDEQLVQRLLTLVMPTAKAGATMAPDSVYFIDKNNAGSLFLCLIEHIANTRGADAHKHLDEIRT
jgi:hypothetical protein